MAQFVHLHTHSHYSLLTALPKIPDLIKAAKKNGMDTLALTDLGNMYGAIDFYTTCKKEDIKPIIGVDFYVALRTRHDKQAGIDNKRHRLVLLAKDTLGYKNLISLVTDSNIEGFYYKPRVDHELLLKYSDSLIAILPSFSSEVADKLKNGNTEGASEILSRYKEIYGHNNVYLEITHHPDFKEHADLMKKIVELARTTDTKLVAAADVYYINPEDKQARNTLLSVQSSGGGARFNDDNQDLSFISEKQALKYFKDLPDALANTRTIADQCNVEIELEVPYFPTFEIPKGTTAEQELFKLVEEGLQKRNIVKDEKVTQQITYELDIINTKGYAPYFLVVADFLRYAHEHDIPTNIRGSVTGSLVTYLIGITHINPFDYGLRFERFLNPDRPSLPDVDMDFADNRRDEVINYARQKYGTDKVAQIGTFGTMAARGSVRDVTRALGYPHALGDRIAKLIPLGAQGMPMTIKKALELEPELKKMYGEEEEIKEIIDLAQKIEGCARHISVHAAGVVIAPTKLTDFTPIQFDPKGGKLITQYDMHAVGEDGAGLPKFDFLGLKNLSILADTLKRIEWHHKKKINLQEIPLDDKKTFEMLARGETMGLFQLNGSGMTHFLKELRPTDIHDINAMVALYRPGPMEFIPEYIKRKNNPALVDYPHERMKEDLEKSYGLLIYQEDVMMSAIKLAGYSWLDADKFRKAMGKKIPALMAEQEEKFMSGCIKNGIKEEVAKDLWQRILPFAAYAFNKAHSASYGRVAYQTAYFKANYPVEYMAAILTADSGDVEKIAEAVAECKRMEIPVLPPDINESFGTFTIVEEEGKPAIRFGLYTIKNFGEGIADAVIEERKTGGRFKNISDFLERVHDRNLNKKSLEALIKCGAMDEFGERGKMLANLDGLLEYNKESAKNHNQGSLFGLMESASIPKLTLQEVPPAPKEDCLLWEKELLGLFISGHPLDRFREKLDGREYTILKIKTSLQQGMLAVAAGMIESSKVILTKKGDKMAFIKLIDFTDSVEIVVFPKTYEQFEKFLLPDMCVAIKGNVSHRDGNISMIAEAVKEI